MNDQRSRALKQRAILCLLMGLFSLLSCEPAAAPKNERADPNVWQSLFNGRDLEGWTAKIRGQELGKDAENHFQARDGEIVVNYPEGMVFSEQFGHLFHPMSTGSYDLEMEYRFFGEQAAQGPGWAKANSGVMIHAQAPATMAPDQPFPASIEVQFLAGLGTGPRPTANLCTPGTHVVMDGKLLKRHCFDSRSKTYPIGTWVRVRVEVRGHGPIRHFVNDELVLSYEQAQIDPNDDLSKGVRDAAANQSPQRLNSGWIALQSESHPVAFRNLRWRPMTD